MQEPDIASSPVMLGFCAGRAASVLLCGPRHSPAEHNGYLCRRKPANQKSHLSSLSSPQDSPINKLLYARDIPRYKQMVER